MFLSKPQNSETRTCSPSRFGLVIIIWKNLPVDKNLVDFTSQVAGTSSMGTSKRRNQGRIFRLSLEKKKRKMKEVEAQERMRLSLSFINRLCVEHKSKKTKIGRGRDSYKVRRQEQRRRERGMQGMREIVRGEKQSLFHQPNHQFTIP